MNDSEMYAFGIGSLVTFAVFLNSGMIVNAWAERIKRQLSPAMELEQNLQSLMRLHDLGYKRSPYGHAAFVSPASDLENKLLNIYSLDTIGKRPALSPADQFAQQFDMMQRLAAAGKKRSLSPAADLQNRLLMTELFEQVG